MQDREKHPILTGKLAEVSPHISNDLMEALGAVMILRISVARLELDPTFLPEIALPKRKAMIETLRMMVTDSKKALTTGADMLEKILEEPNSQS